MFEDRNSGTIIDLPIQSKFDPSPQNILSNSRLNNLVEFLRKEDKKRLSTVL